MDIEAVQEAQAKLGRAKSGPKRYQLKQELAQRLKELAEAGVCYRCVAGD